MAALRVDRVSFFYITALLVLMTFTPNTANAYTPGKFGGICNTIIEALATDNLGSLLAALAGVGAIIASAMGGFKAAWGLVVVSVSSFILKAYIDIWFAAGDCQAGS
jgi:hypothetical protein